MGKKRCAVDGCQSASTRAEDVGVTFHQLPANLATRAIWIYAGRVPDENNVKVCSRHFREADFKLVNTKYFLIKGCYPTIFPWGIYEHDKPTSGEAAPEKPPLPEPVAVAAPPAEASSDQPPTAEPPKATALPAAVPAIAKRHSIAGETIRSVPLDEAEPQIPLRKSMESAGVPVKKEGDLLRRVDPVPGNEISAMDFQNVWHKAKILEVDSVERELLIHFEEDNLQKLVDEWIPMDSSRLRPLSGDIVSIPEAPVSGPSPVESAPLVQPKFKENEKCLARWNDSRKFKATVKSILPNGLYEVLFDDGFVKTVKLKHMSKLRASRTPLKKAPAPALPVVNLVDGEEWYCQWVDDCPLGLSSALEGVPAKVRIVEVADARLPPGWKKFFSERLHGGTKWDVVVMGPCGRRFRGRQDVRAYVEETANTQLNLADFDFAMHKKRAKEKGVYTYTDNYRKLLKALYPSMTEIDVTPPTPLDVQEVFLAQQPPMLLEPMPEIVTRDWLMVDGMKVQIIDNLLRCPEEGCLKNFRKENLLKMHIKHYHETMAKKISATPTMTDLAAKRQSLVEQDAVPLARTPALDGQVSPQKNVRRNPDKAKSTADSTGTQGWDAGGGVAVAVKDDTELLHPPEPQLSILEQALNSGVMIKVEEGGHERMYPKATAITDQKKSGLSNKRKYVRKNVLADLTDTRPKKIKLEPVDVAGSDESLLAEISASVPQEVARMPQEYINEHGEIIKIVRMRKEEIINCLCHYPEEDGLMIQCDLCLCWQHGRCNDIEKESQVPDKYVCYICRNPERARQSMKYVHDQDWLLDGKLPRGTYHTQGTANDPKRTETLKRVNTLTGNLLELKRIMHSLRVKINIADNKDHPKAYLWSKRWEAGEASSPQKGGGSAGAGGVKDESEGPKPEAAIDTRECQRRLMEHIKHVQSQLNGRMDDIEKYVDQIEAESEVAREEEEAAEDHMMPRYKQTIHMMMADLTTMKEIAQC